MCFKEIYEKVDKCIEYDIYELLENENIDIVRDNDWAVGRLARIMSYGSNTIIFLKEGLDNQEENNANLFMCLYLLKNEI